MSDGVNVIETCNVFCTQKQRHSCRAINIELFTNFYILNANVNAKGI